MQTMIEKVTVLPTDHFYEDKYKLRLRDDLITVILFNSTKFSLARMY